MILKIGMMVWGALCVFWTTGNAQDFQVMTSKAPDMTFQQGDGV